MTTDLVPVANMAELDTYTPQDREVAITGMLDQARTWLAHAVESSAPAQDIANFKAFIATAAETARRLKVSKEIQVDAEVMVRRSERALGQAIRDGQERGEIRSNGQHGEAGRETTSSSPKEFFAHNEEAVASYAMTDGVTDADFETALTRAQDEQNVSRANVVRKVREVAEPTYREQQADKWARVAEMAERGHASAQIARELGVSESGLRQGARDRGIDIRAGREAESDIDRIVRAAGLVVSEDKVPGAVACVGTLTNMYGRFGPGRLARTLNVSHGAYGDTGLTALVLHGVGLALDRYGRDIEDVRLVNQLTKTRINRLSQRAEDYHLRTGNLKSHCFAAAVVDAYNEGLHGRSAKRVPSWWKDAE